MDKNSQGLSFADFESFFSYLQNQIPAKNLLSVNLQDNNLEFELQIEMFFYLRTPGFIYNISS